MKTLIKNNLQLSIVAALALLLVLVAAPIIYILKESMFVEGGFNLIYPIQVIKESNLTKPFINTLVLGILVVVGTTIIALPLAFITAKTEIGKHKFLDIVLLIPFMTPPYIGSMGWIIFMQPMGFLNQLCPLITGQEEVFFTWFGLVSIMSLHSFPFIYLILKNALERININLENAAIVHGASNFKALIKITGPLIFSSYILGSLLVFIKAIGEFGTPATFGRKIGFKVLTTEIHRYISTWPISFSKATSISYLLLFACMFIWCIQAILSRKYSYKTVEGKGIKKSKKKLGQIQKTLCYTYIFAVLFLAIGIPYFSIIATSLIDLRGYGLAKGNFTFSHYREVFAVGSNGFEAFTNSLKIAFIVATICAIIGLLLSLVIVNKKGFLSKMVDFFSLMPNSIPAIVMVIGLILFWNRSNSMLPIYNTIWMVILTYVVFYIPYGIQYTKASLMQISSSLIRAAEVSGGNKGYNLMWIILPLVFPGILSGWMMTFTIAFRELVGALMILPPGMETASTYIFRQFEQGEASLGMAMATLSVTITTIILILLKILTNKGNDNVI